MVMQCFKYNQHFVAMMNIINLAKIQNVDGKFEKHHIVPRCWFKINNLPVDNSADNLVNLTKEQHAKVHMLIPLCCDDKIASRMNRCKSLMNGVRNLGRKLDELWIKHCAEGHKGLHLSEEHRKKISEANKGRIFSKEHCSNISLANKGKQRSEETKKKLSECTKGDKNGFYGKRHSEETKKKLSESHKGFHHSEYTRRKMSESRKGRKFSNGSLGMHWYNNGIVNKLTYECPEGFVKGMMIYG